MLGFLVAVVATRHLDLVVATLLGLMMLGASCVLTHWASRTALAVVGLAVILLNLIPHLASLHFESAWIARVLLGATAIALVLSSLRWLDFRMVRLIEGVDRQSLDIATGRSLDEWLMMLKGANGSSLQHASIRRLLREEGIDEYWQKKITEAFEKSVGRRAIKQQDDGSSCYVDVKRLSLSEKLAVLQRQRFSIRDMMLASFAVACVAALLKWLPSFRPQALDLTLGLPMVLSLTIATMFTLVACLTPDIPRPGRPLLLAVLMIGAVFGAFQFIGLVWRYQYFATILFGIVIVAMAMMAAICTSLRHRGFRLLRVTMERSVVQALEEVATQRQLS